jgi:KUP system potassium uptake protein
MVFTLMSNWKTGRRILAARLRAGTLPITEFLGSNVVKSAARVTGTAVFMNSNADRAPLALINYLKYNMVLHARILILRMSA